MAQPDPQQPGYQTPERKKEEYRKYLDRAGVVGALTKVLVALYEETERPPNAVEFIKQHMGAEAGGEAAKLREECEELRTELEHQKDMVKHLTAEVEDLRSRVDDDE